uniref:Uncharacterized protein n=1 Tax=Loa loa TaxID=7209 RepID=A0A1I7VTL5_LOALO
MDRLKSGYSLASNKGNIEKQEICDIRVNANKMVIHPSTIPFLHDMLSNDGQINRREAKSKEDSQRESMAIEIEKNNLINSVTSKLAFHPKQSLSKKRPVEITANVALNMKQAPIRTLLSRKEDEYDLIDEECEPDWVTSSFRLGSIRRRKNERNVAMQRIQKEIELEKQRHREMVKMRRNDHITLY